MEQEKQQTDTTAIRLQRNQPIFNRAKQAPPKPKPTVPPPANPNKPNPDNEWLAQAKTAGHTVRVSFLDGTELTGKLHKIRKFNFVCGDTLVFKGAVKCIVRTGTEQGGE